MERTAASPSPVRRLFSEADVHCALGLIPPGETAATAASPERAQLQLRPFQCRMKVETAPLAADLAPAPTSHASLDEVAATAIP